MMKYQFPFQLLKSNRNVRNLWMGETISCFGDNFYNIAIMWFVFSKTGSGLQTGLIVVSSFLPQVVIGPILGALADRLNRKRMMQLASVSQAALAGLLALVMFLGVVNLWEIYTVSVLLAVFQLAYTPARAGMFPDLVEKSELLRGNAMFSTSQQIARLVGATSGGALIALMGAPTAIAFDALTFLISALSIQRVAYMRKRAAVVQREAQTSIFHDIRGGWNWLWGQKGLLILISIGTMSNIALGPTNVLAPMLIRNVMHAGPNALGIFDASIGLGIVAGGLLLGSLSAKRVGILFACGVGLEGAALTIVAVAHKILIADAGNFVLGLAVIAANLPTSTLFQVLVPEEMRGRVGAISSMLSSVAIPITYGGVGVFGDLFGARLSYGAGALLLGCCMFLGISTSSLRRLSTRDSIADTDALTVSM